MRPYSVRSVVVILCAGAALAASGPSSIAQGDTMSALVTVLAPAKGPVTNLTAKDFTVHSGSRALEVTAAEHATQPLSIELLADNSQPMGMTSAMADLRMALDGFAKTIRAGEPDAQIGLYTFAGQAIPVVKLGAPAADLQKAISQLFLIQEPTGPLLEALEDASHDLAERPAPRRAIVSIDFATAESTPQSAMPDVDKHVYQVAPTVWAVSVAAAVAESRTRDLMLTAVTHRTGGARMSIINSSGLPNQLKIIANSLLSQYTIQFPRPSGDLEELTITTPKGKARATMFTR